jgi:hypothetical protein
MTKRTAKQREIHNRRVEIKKLREIVADPSTKASAWLAASTRLRKLEEDARRIELESSRQATQRCESELERENACKMPWRVRKPPNVKSCHRSSESVVFRTVDGEK